MSLAKLLKQSRVESGLTIRGLAQKSGVGKSTISRWEQGLCLPDVPELSSVLDALRASEETIQAAWSLIPRPRTRELTAQFEYSGDLLRALRHRSDASLSEIALRLGVSKATLCKYESGDRRPDPEALRRISECLGASEQEQEALQHNAEGEIEPKSFEERLNELETAVKTGSKTPLDLPFLSLEAKIRRELQRNPKSTDFLTRVRALYIEWLGWWYRDREAGTWAERQLGNMIASRRLPVWGRVVRARNVHYSEFGPKEPVVRMAVLRNAIEVLEGTANEAIILRELASELIGLGLIDQAIGLLEKSRNCSTVIENLETHHFCCDMVESHAWLSNGQVDRAAKLLKDCPPNDPYLKVSSTVGKSKVLVAVGQSDTALKELENARAEATQNGYHHFARTARNAMDAIERDQSRQLILA